MTDDTGILQHAIFSVPNSLEGYTTDDNARALIVATLLNASALVRQPRACEAVSAVPVFFVARLLTTRLEGSETFSAMIADGRKILDLKTAMAAPCGHWERCLAVQKTQGLRGAAGRLFEAAVPAALTFTSPRAWAFSVLGMQAYLDWFPGDRVIQGARNALANRLLDIYERSHSETWQWFEKSLSYSNARLSQALLLAGWQSGNKRMVEVGCESLKWLVAEQHRGDADIFVPIGSRECFAEGGEKARFDQQPVEACATISACLLAYRLTNEKPWLEEAWCAFRWFLGENDLQVPLYDATTGGCRDGLHPDRVNENQGAESTLSFLMALLEMQSLETATVEELNQEMSVSI